MPTILRLRRTGYDVVHIHWVPRGIIGILSGRPFLVQAHGSDLHAHVNTAGLYSLCRAVLERARTIFYVTPNLEPFIHRFASKAVYLPNPVNVRAAGLSPRAPERVRRVVIFMRLDPVKGVEKVFPAAERLAGLGIEITALHWGSLADEYAGRYGGAVRFVDPVPHDRVGEFLQASPYGGTGQPCRLGHLADPSSSDGAGFHRSPEAACAFIQERAQDGKLRCNSLGDRVLHRTKHTTLIGVVANLFWRAS